MLLQGHAMLLTDTDLLPAHADQVAPAVAGEGIVDGEMHKLGRVEVSAQLAVDAVEQVEVEPACDAAFIVISGQDDTGILLQVVAQEEQVAGPKMAAQFPQEGA